MKLIDILTEDVSIKPIVSKLDLTSVDTLRNSMRDLSQDELNQVTQYMNDTNAAAKNKVVGGNGIELYHGTKRDRAEKIKASGFELTKGERSGFMGSSEFVENQGIFLTDSKQLAHLFGENRGERDYEILTVHASVNNLFTEADMLRDIKKAALKLINDYNGTKSTRIPKREWWWLLDQKEFISLLKSKGYQGVKFKEAPSVLKQAGTSEAHTYLIFDPDKIMVEKGHTQLTTFTDLYDHFKSL